MRPDPERSRRHYSRLAASYDATCRWTHGVRRRTISLLDLRPGDVVVDVASGTGMSFPFIVDAIGPRGRLYAIEHSPEMMAIARRRVQEAGWRNVTLIETMVESVRLPAAFDAALLHYTHDILQSPAALETLFGHAKPGARIAAAGIKFTSWWLAPVNLWVAYRARGYVTTFSGLDQPWRHLVRHVPDLAIESVLLDTSYVARGRVARKLATR